MDRWPTKQYKKKDDDITFEESDVNLIHHPPCDALVIKAMMANNNVYRILGDNGSLVDILYYQAFQRMGLKDNDLRPSPNPIYRFIGDSIVPVGIITLPLIVGEYPRESCVMADFLVIDQPSAFNAVLGRPSLKALKAITSIYHLLMKFPTSNRVGQVRGNQEEAKRCYNQAVRSASRPRQVNVVDQRPPSEEPLDDTNDPRSSNEKATTGPIEDLVDLPVDSNKPTKVLKLGKNLSDKLREAISTILKENLDLFAWKHSDMEGIDPMVMCHHLNLDSDKNAVRQKRRAIDAEQYQTLKDEADKLFTCDFIKESFYPSWLANPVLVKKPNDKWRTCVDFTNLNKACPKDNFPLL